MEPTTVPDCDAALDNLAARLRVANLANDDAARDVLNANVNRILDMRLALTKPRVKVGAP